MEIEMIRRSNLTNILNAGGRGYAKELAELIGCEPSYLSQIKTGKKNMGSTFARQLEVALKKHKGWLDHDHQSDLDKEVERRLNAEFALEAIPGQTNHIIPFSKGEGTLAKNGIKTPDAIPIQAGKIPLISWVNAGDWEDPIDNYTVGDAEKWLHCPPDCNPATTFALLVTGESMDDGTARGYRDGEYIFVDGSKIQLEHNSDVVMKNGEGKVTFKRLVNSNGVWFLKPLNPNWPEKIIELDEESHIVGRVMFSGLSR